MKILYFGKLCDLDIFKKKELKQQPYFVAQYMYEKALYEQFSKDQDIDIDVISIFQTEYYPEDCLFFSKKKSYQNFKYLPFINIPFLRELSYFFTACFQIAKWFIRNKGSSSKYLYSSCHFPPVSAAIIVMSKVLSIKTVVTFTDLPLFTYSKDRIKKMKIYKRLIIKPYLKLINFLQESYDYYVLFSLEMNKVVNSRNKPYVVVEGIYNGNDLDLKIPAKTNTIVHAGTLNREVGIKKILDVFSLVNCESIELWFIGKGDMVDEITAQSIKDKRIKYLGFLPRKDVFEKLKEAKLLINLRNPDDLYTKYSFPSKMFEYMVSGTPVLSTKLGGMPEEYYQHIFTVDSYDDRDICDQIMRILELDNESLENKGYNAQQFILTQKNARIQKERIIKFLRYNK